MPVDHLRQLSELL